MGKIKRDNRASAPTIAGLLSIISAVATILFVFIIFAVEYSRYYAGELPVPPGSTYFLAFGGLRIVVLVASILAITGGVFAIRRKNWLLSLIGVAASIFCPPAVLGVIATILVASSKKEFEIRKNPENKNPLDITK